jgi:hypothetical protein
MTTAQRGVSMVRAQWTAWSERRSQGGASVVVITGVLPAEGRACGGLSTADHTDTGGYAPLIWRLPGVDTGRSVDNYRVVDEGVLCLVIGRGREMVDDPPGPPRTCT